MVTQFESLPDELIMSIIELIDNPLSIFLNLNWNINRILFDYRIKLSVKVDDHQHVLSLQTNLTRLISTNFQGENLEKFENFKSLTLFINEDTVDSFQLPLSLIYLKIHLNTNVPPSLFHPLLTLKRLETLIIINKKESNVTFPLCSIVLNENIRILQIKNIPVAISSISHCEKLTKLKYLELKLIEASGPFHDMPSTFPSSLKTLILHFKLSFTDLEHVLHVCCSDHLKHLELYSHTKSPQMDYFDAKRWCKLFERFENLTKCQIQLRQQGGRGLYRHLSREFARQLKATKELKTIWNMECMHSCPGYHGTIVYVQISANL